MISHGNINSSISQAIVMAKAQLEVIAVCYIIYHPLNFLQTQSILSFFWQPPEDIPIILALLPLHHTYGLHMYSFRSCLTRATLVLMPRWDTKLALKIIPK